MNSTLQNRKIESAAALTLLSWSGEAIHNAVELPRFALISLVTSIPAMESLSLFLACLKLPRRGIWILQLFV